MPNTRYDNMSSRERIVRLETLIKELHPVLGESGTELMSLFLAELKDIRMRTTGSGVIEHV
jgi:dsDNA-binding SOS-regulon protein